MKEILQVILKPCNKINLGLTYDFYIFQSLLEQTDFIVVGVVGYQGAGKSTILSLLGDGRNKDTTKR